MKVLLLAVLSVAFADNLKTVYVSGVSSCPTYVARARVNVTLNRDRYVATLAGLTASMEDPEIGRIFLNNSIALAGAPLPTIDGRLLEILAGPRCATPCSVLARGSRIFNVGGEPGGLILAGLTLRDARSSEGNGSALYVAPGVRAGGGTLSANRVQFVNNSAAGDGGAVYAGLHAILSFGSCDFVSNAAKSGGAIAAYGAQVGLDGSTFTRNVASDGGGALFLEGGNASLSVAASTFADNHAGAGGGGAVAVGRATTDRARSDVGTATAAVSQSTFARNYAEGPGGAVRLGPFGHLAMDESIFAFNGGTRLGGALAADAPNPTAIANTTFAMNYVAQGGGGAALAFGSDPTGASPPAGAASVLNNVTAVNNTVTVGDDGEPVEAHGAGVLIVEGELLFDGCHFADNHNRNLPAPDEDDVCAFGKATTAIFKAGERPATCSACGGAGTCV